MLHEMYNDRTISDRKAGGLQDQLNGALGHGKNRAGPGNRGPAPHSGQKRGSGQETRNHLTGPDGKPYADWGR
jgi:hypothetical protein